MVGQFWRHQRIWIKVRSDEQPMPDGSGTAEPPSPGWLALMLESYMPMSSFRGEGCIRFEFEVINYNHSPLEVRLPDMLFLRYQGDPTLYSTDEATMNHFGIDDDYVVASGQTQVYEVPICKPDHGGSEIDDLRLGVMTSIYETSTGSAGMEHNPSRGTDTTFWINFWEYAPECAYPPSRGIYPECAVRPPIPSNLSSFINEQSGGRLGDFAPVSIPPCYYITRGFGCSQHPTGVSGAGRCPSSMPYWHTGIDISCSTGVPVTTPMGGVVSHYGCYKGNCSRGYGLLVTVHKEQFDMMFGHLSSVSHHPLCSSLGGPCEMGYEIGRVGSTGMSTGPHLHWEFRVSNVPVDPHTYFGGSVNRPAGVAAINHPSDTIDYVPPEYPLTVYLRDESGSPLTGPDLILSGIDGEEIESATFVDGRVEFRLAENVYSFALAGDLSDGTPVHSVGVVNQRALETNPAYLYDALNVWHAAPGAVIGLVLSIDEHGVAQPLLDHNPTGTPFPLNPLADETLVNTAVSPQPTVNRWLWMLIVLVFLCIPLGAYILALRRKRRHGS